MEFQVLLLQIFEAVFITLAIMHSKTVVIDGHLDLSQKEQSLAVTVMTLQRNNINDFLQLCSKDTQQWATREPFETVKMLFGAL